MCCPSQKGVFAATGEIESTAAEGLPGTRRGQQSALATKGQISGCNCEDLVEFQ